MVYGRYPYSRGIDKLAFDRSAKDREIMYKRIKQDMASFPDLAGMESVVAIRKVGRRRARAPFPLFLPRLTE
jgi:hypothetical protein